jgi:large subunit ribosomal protein L23
MNPELFRLIKREIRTEKSVSLHEKGNTYVFEVDHESNKTEIRHAIEKIFSVKIKSLTSLNQIGKVKRVRSSMGKQSGYKKVYVTLKDGFSINLEQKA